ncbi:RAD50-interacting protein 1 [Anoplophora glabripennis]|nr:RAD50-interacting protein 1 [Anoplophora glabripennis]
MVSCSTEIKRKVVQELNEKYGKDLLDLEKCRELHRNLLAQKAAIEKELDVTSTESSIGKSVKNAQDVVKRTEDVIERGKDIIGDIKKDLEDVDEVRNEVKEHFDKLNTLQCTLQYMRVIQHIEYLSAELQREIGKRDDEKCATLFANLTEISRNLADFSGVHLRDYLKETIHHWHNILKDKFAKDFDEVLKAIKWPFVSTNFSLVVPLPTYIHKLQIISEYLLQIELPSEASEPVITSALLSDFPPLCLPLHFLAQPLRKRFFYHFYGARQTNRPDKPEWYFTQILTWIRDHRDFVGKYIQPVIDKLGLHHIDAKLELIRGLVQLAVEKLYSELPSLQYDDFTFSHSIDEALGFDKELREIYDYPTNQPSILAVLTQAQVFVKWLAMEKKYAIEKMDAMLPPNSLDAFDPLTSDVEDLKITTCADTFITLQQTITERYESLPQPGHRLQFLELQLELLDDFRVRLLQIVNAEEGDVIESKILAIANSIYYIENVLIDWGAMLHYLNLYYYKSQLEMAKQPVSPTSTEFEDSQLFEIETDTVFAETLSLYRHMRKDILNTLAETVIIEIKRKSRDYRRERWAFMKTAKEFRSLSLTPSACPMFEILSKRLHQLQKSLQSKLFTYVWRSIAQQLDTYLFEDLVLDTRFSEGGALQLKFDVTRNLIPLFSQFSERPNNYFAQLIESCVLLNISKGSALLLRETILALEGATGVEDTRGKALKEIGISNFTPKMAVKILNQRVDITFNRISID